MSASTSFLYLFLAASGAGILVTLGSVAIARSLRRQQERLPAATRLEHVEHLLAVKQEDLTALADQVREKEGTLAQRDQAAAEAKLWLERLDEARQELTGMDIRRQELEACKRNLAECYEEIVAANGDLATVRANKDQLTSEVHDLKRDIQQFKSEQDRLTKTLQDMEKRKSELESSLAALDKTRQAKGREVEKLDKDLDDRRTSLSTLQDDVNKARKERDAMQDKAQTLRAEVAGLKASKTALGAYVGRMREAQEERTKSSLAELLTPPACFQEKRPLRTNLSEPDAIQRIHAHLTALGLRFSPRTINAFHTCLKTAEISPLTVLAGISGTGKSELPRRYAEALGIHFVQLSVQPRWDSPQDLFGFYNYLESRYKATELARAMVHLDGNNWPEQAKAYKDHMLLVLLDEMNLARVEYYFSEFLSRLEARGSGSRNAREIELDLGPVQSGHRSRVLPGGNLLFAGTMNEDESTQTLSDKVVDRANVLRFARPFELADATQESSGQPADFFLSLSAWNSWHRASPAPNHLAQLRVWMGRLNKALDGIGRPFGHRVNKAILAYVANHPEVGTHQGVQQAFADQIELRILPKLRGVEPDAGENRTHLAEIQQLIKSLGDDPLADSFEEAMTRELFVWPGVRREEGH